MKIKLKNTPEQIELIKAMGSRDKTVAFQAQQAFADFITPVIQQVLELATFSSLIYVDWPYNEDDIPTLPLDLFYDSTVDTVQVWSQNTAGGLGTNLITGLQEMGISTYRLDSAVSFNNKNLRRGRLPYVTLGINRMQAEIARKQERNAFLVVFRGLAEASTQGVKHTITSTTKDVVQVDDFNRLITLHARINVAWDRSGTPTAPYSQGPTDAFISPEIAEEIRSFLYEPQNTRATPNTDESTVLALPDAIRGQFWNTAGVPALYGMDMHIMNEMGVGKRYNNLFAQFATTGIGPAGGNFDTTADELVLLVDTTREALIRPIAQNADTGSTLVINADNQYLERTDKSGYYVSLEEGRLLADSRIVQGLVV